MDFTPMERNFHGKLHSISNLRIILKEVPFSPTLLFVRIFCHSHRKAESRLQ